MKIKLYALLLEDVKRDAELLEEILSENGFDPELVRVDNKEDFTSKLKRGKFDIIYADFTLPSFNGESALEIARQLSPNVPFICVSGTIGEDRAVELLKLGATDYVLKDRMERVPMATKRALDAVEQLNRFRETQIELQTNRRLLQSIINNALDCIFIKDIDGKYLLFNEAAERLFSVSEKEIIGKDDSFLFPDQIFRRHRELDNQVINGAAPITFEEVLTTSDGVERTFHTIKCPMFDDFGNPTGLFGIARDITERKKLERILVESKEKAEESNRFKTEFLNNISHEIRTPMNAIAGFSELLKLSDSDITKQKEYIDIITENCFHLLDIINDIIIIASLASKQTTLNYSTFSINDVIHEIYAKFETNAKNKKLVFTFESLENEEGDKVYSDKLKVTHILYCLVNNAIKFTREGEVRFGCVKKGSEFEFFVSDTGIGIPKEKQHFIFEQFRQVSKAVSDEFGGTGLGLTISKEYTEMLGGRIFIESELGKGSNFYFTIPAEGTP